MRIRQGVAGVGAVFAVLGLLVQACAGDPVPIDEEDSGPVLTADSGKDSSTAVKDAGKDTATPVADAAKVDSSVRDATVDSGPVDAGDRPGDPFDPNAPKTGAACPATVNVNDVIERRCGKCGKQSALCETGRIVGVYGACSGESVAVDACLPGAATSQACGLCGRQSVQCGNDCKNVALACAGEVAGGCVAGSVKYLATCANPAEVRRQVCSAACVANAPEACAARGPDSTLVVAQAAAGVVTQTLTPDAAAKIPAISSPYCATTLSTTISSIYNYVLLSNPGAQAANVTVNNKSAAFDVGFAAYAGTTLPGNRLACLDHVGINKFTVEIPAGGSQLVYVGALSATASGTLPIEVVTNFVGAEVPAAPDYTLAISQTMGATATQAITFDENKFAPVTASLNAPADYTGFHPCPVVKMGVELPQRFVRLTNSGAAARTVNLITTSIDDDSYMAVYPSVPTFSGRRTCTGSYNDDCDAGDFNACLNAVSIPANGSVVVYVGQDTFDGIYDTNSLSVTTTN